MNDPEEARTEALQLIKELTDVSHDLGSHLAAGNRITAQHLAAATEEVAERLRDMVEAWLQGDDEDDDDDA